MNNTNLHPISHRFQFIDLKTFIFCFILSTVTSIRIDSVMRPRSSSRGHDTIASVTVTVIADYWSNLRFLPGGVPFFNTLDQDESINSGPQNSA